MRPGIRLLVAGAGAAAVVASSTRTRADVVAECDAAYKQTQLSRRAGKLIEAREQALVCGASTCPEADKSDCTQWLAELDASMPTVMLAAKDASGADTLRVRVLLDGHAFREALDTKSTPIDPGEHVLRFEMPGEDAIERKVLIREGERSRRIAVSFGAAPPAAPSHEAEPAPPSPGAPAWAWVSGGLGIVAVGAGVTFAALALKASSSASAICDLSNCLPTTGHTLAQAQSFSSQHNVDSGVAIGLSVLGAAGLGVGIYGLASHSARASAAAPAAMLVPLALRDGAGIGLGGRF